MEGSVRDRMPCKHVPVATVGLPLALGATAGAQPRPQRGRKTERRRQTGAEAAGPGRSSVPACPCAEFLGAAPPQRPPHCPLPCGGARQTCGATFARGPRARDACSLRAASASCPRPAAQGAGAPRAGPHIEPRLLAAEAGCEATTARCGGQSNVVGAARESTESHPPRLHHRGCAQGRRGSPMRSTPSTPRALARAGSGQAPRPRPRKKRKAEPSGASTRAVSHDRANCTYLGQIEGSLN